MQRAGSINKLFTFCVHEDKTYTLSFSTVRVLLFLFTRDSMGMEGSQSGGSACTRTRLWRLRQKKIKNKCRTKVQPPTFWLCNSVCWRRTQADWCSSFIKRQHVANEMVVSQSTEATHDNDSQVPCPALCHRQCKRNKNQKKLTVLCTWDTFINKIQHCISTLGVLFNPA